MSFFDDLTKKAKVVATTASEKARDAAESARISAAIIAEKRELEKSYRAIGQWYFSELGEDIPEGVADLVAAVRASQDKIAALQASKEIVEEEKISSWQTPEATENVETVEAEVVGQACPVCGKYANSRFCPHCGAPMGT